MTEPKVIQITRVEIIALAAVMIAFMWALRGCYGDYRRYEVLDKMHAAKQCPGDQYFGSVRWPNLKSPADLQEPQPRRRKRMKYPGSKLTRPSPSPTPENAGDLINE